MRFGTYLLVVSILASSCAHEVLKHRTYSGEVISVDAAEGQYYAPEKGPAPLTFIVVRINGDAPPGNTVRVKLALTSVYTAALYGSVGDSISFRYFDNLPFSGELAFRDIDEYRVVRRKG